MTPDAELANQLEQALVEQPLLVDRPGLRIVAARVSSAPGLPVQVTVDYDYRGRHGAFERPFDADELRILTDPELPQTVLAIATWVRDELNEHISDLIGSDELPSGA
jgi:hypothetical protein